MKNIKISDITLREAGRTRALPFKERVEIARTLDRLRLDVIELPPIRDEKADVLSNKTIASVVTGSILSAAAGLTEEGVAAAKDAIYPDEEGFIQEAAESCPVGAIEVEP